MPFSSKTPERLKPSIVSRLQKSAKFDLVFVLFTVVFMIAASLFLEIELIEKFYSFTRAHEEWELDDILLSLLWLGLGSMIYVVRRMRDIKALNKEIVRLAYYDPITDLPNRTLALDRLDKKLMSAKRYGGSVVVFFIDFDNFKTINDTYGHAAGDEMIRQVGLRLSNVVRADETIARLGGDEFLLIAKFKNDVNNMSKLLARIQGTQDTPFVVHEQVLNIKYSIGVAVYPNDGMTAKEIVKAADFAMYEAKRKGSGCYAFHSKKFENDR